MGWIRTVEPGHTCLLPEDELATHFPRTKNNPNGDEGKHDEGSVWVCPECQQIWVVVWLNGDYPGLAFTQITPRLRKKYKL